MVVLGILLAIVAFICFGSAIAVQKFSMGSMKKFNIIKMVTNKIWLSSIAVSLVGVVSYLISLSSAPLTTVQPIVSASIVVPIIAGFIFFKEKMEVRQWLVVAVLIAGIILVSAF